MCTCLLSLNILNFVAGPREKSFQAKSSQMAGKWYFEIAFFETKLLYKRSILLSFRAEFTECVLEFLLHPESTIKPTIAGPGEKF